MATFQRGYSFAATEIVNETKLNQLITSAQLSAISWSEFAGDAIGISVYSALSSVSAGWLWYQYEPSKLTVSAYSDTLSEATVMLQSIAGPVALFKNGGFETRRLVAAHGPTGQFGILGSGLMPATANAAITLTVNFESGANNDGNAHFLGVNSGFTTSTSPTDASALPRLTLRGYCAYRNDTPANNLSSTHRYIFQGVNADGRFTSTGSTSIDKIIGVEMSNGSSDQLRPGWFFGAPIWRT